MPEFRISEKRWSVDLEQRIQQEHYADDEAENTGKPAEKIDGPQESYEFTASAVQIENPKG